MPDELAIVGTVAHVGFGVAVAEQVAEKGASRPRNLRCRSAVVAPDRRNRVVSRKVLAVALVQAADSHVGNLPSWRGS